jgi:hypothetical protein
MPTPNNVLTTNFIAVPEPEPPRKKVLFCSRLEYGLSGAEEFSVAAHQQRENALLRGRSAARDGDVRYFDAFLGTEPGEVDQQLAQARSTLATAQANLELAQITKDRYEGLLIKHAVSQQDVDNALEIHPKTGVLC